MSATIPVQSYVTVPDLAARVSAPAWLTRRLVDKLDRGRCRRVARLFRLVPDDLAEEVLAELRRRGYTRPAEGGGQ
jgi:hypothetical protein